MIHNPDQPQGQHPGSTLKTFGPATWICTGELPPAHVTCVVAAATVGVGLSPRNSFFSQRPLFIRPPSPSFLSHFSSILQPVPPKTHPSSSRAKEWNRISFSSDSCGSISARPSSWWMPGFPSRGPPWPPKSTSTTSKLPRTKV